MANKADLTERSIVIVFNSVTKTENDVLFAQIAAWPEVEGTSYEEQLRQHMPEDKRFDRGIVVVKDESEVVKIHDRLEVMSGVRSAIGPLRTLKLYE